MFILFHYTMNPTNCSYGGTSVFTYASNGVPVYAFIEGGVVSDNEYSTILTAVDDSSTPTGKQLMPLWGTPLTGATTIYLQYVSGGRYKNYPPGNYTLKVYTNESNVWEKVDQFPFSIGQIPFSLDEETMTLSGTTSPTNVYIRLYSGNGNSYEYPAWTCTYQDTEEPNAPAGERLINPSPLWSLTAFTLPTIIYLEQPPASNSEFFVYLNKVDDSTNPYTLQITDYLQIYYEKDISLGVPTISASEPVNGTMQLTVTNFPQIGYVSIHIAPNPEGQPILDWGQTYDNGSLVPVWKRQFTKTRQTITLELVQVRDTNVYPYTPGITYAVRLADYRNLYKYYAFTVPSPTITRDKSSYAYTDHITFTTAGIRNGTLVKMTCSSYSSAFPNQVMEGTVTTSFPPTLTKETSTLPLAVFLRETFQGTCQFTTYDQQVFSASTSSFTILPPTPIQILPSYAVNAQIMLGSDFSGNVYLVIYDTKTYYHDYGTGPNITLTGTDVYNTLDGTSKTLPDLYDIGGCYIVCEGKVTSTFTVTAEPITLTRGNPEPSSYIYDIQLTLTSTGITSPKPLFLQSPPVTGSVLYSGECTGPISSPTSNSFFPYELTYAQTSLPRTVFINESCVFVCEGVSTSSFTINSPLQNGIVVNDSPTYGSDIHISGLDNTKRVFLVKNSPRDYFDLGMPDNGQITRMMDNTISLIHLYDRIQTPLEPSSTIQYYIANGDNVSIIFTLPNPAAKMITSDKSAYLFSDTITLTSTLIMNGSGVTLYNNPYETYSYSAALETINTNQSVNPIQNIQTLSSMPLTVFTLHSSSQSFIAGSDGQVTSSFTIDPPTNSIPQSNVVVGDTLSFTGFDSGSKFLVTYDSVSGKIYYCNAGTSILLETTSEFHALYTSDVKQLNELLNGTVYIAGINQVSSSFRIIDGNVSNISLQWSTVYQDNLELVKAGLYNTNVSEYHYFNSLETPQDVSGNDIENIPFPIDSSSSSRIHLVLSGVTNKYLSYNGSTQNLGINNNDYYLNVNTPIRVDGTAISITGGDYSQESITEPISIPQTSGSKNVITVVNIDRIAYAEILDITDADDSVVGFLIHVGPFTYIAGVASDSGIPYVTDGTILVNGVYVQNLSTNYAYDNGILSSVLDNGAIAKNIYWHPPDRFRVETTTQPSSSCTLYTTKPNLQWGSNGTSTVLFSSKKEFRSGDLRISVMMPVSTPTSNYEAKIFTYINGEVPLNKFVASANAGFVISYIPPTISLRDIRYTNLISSSLTTTNNYIPTMIPGGDYITSKTSTNEMYLLLGGDPTMSADRCRQAWRLSHYVRTILPPGELITYDEMIKIAYNTAAALVYNASMDHDYPGRLTLDVNMYKLTNSYGGYSGDMVPPLLALIDAFTLKGVEWETDIPAYSEAIKTLNGTGNNTLSYMTTALTNGSQSIYPVLDSRTSGGQQYGLGGCGFICTLDFLYRENFEVMLKYDNITTWSECANYYNRPTSKMFEDAEFQDLIQVYKLLGLRGNGFQLPANWALSETEPIPTQSDFTSNNYSSLILTRAYLTNLRIRNVNVTINDELSFGPNYQGTQYGTSTTSSSTTNRQCFLFAVDPSQPTVSGATYGDPLVASSNYPANTVPKNINTPYVYTDFPMYGIPDSGWGSLTVEIFSYLGIMYVGMNDYQNFCKWHRTFWHLLFIQNGGNMYGWNNNSDTDKILPNNTSNVKKPPSTFWRPAYVSDEDDNANWVETLNTKQIHSFNVFKFPPENYYDTKGVENCTTDYWANRYNPYRGNSNEQQHIQWTTPSYCMGYSPAWVAGGKTDISDFNTGIHRPIAEALNPLFTNTSGLYTATDGDQNILQAYILASLRWPTPPDDAQNNFNSNDGFVGSQPECPTANTGGGPYGYNCDVSDFLYNTDIPGNSNKGVKYAVDSREGTPELNPATNNTRIRVTDKIGYGITKTDDGWMFPTDPAYPTERCTTWAYIAKAIQRTIISQNGNGWGSSFGNFTSLNGFTSVGGATGGARFETLGHDSSASTGNTKLDYIDLRLYQVCETVTTLPENA